MSAENHWCLEPKKQAPPPPPSLPGPYIVIEGWSTKRFLKGSPEHAREWARCQWWQRFSLWCFGISAGICAILVVMTAVFAVQRMLGAP